MKREITTGGTFMKKHFLVTLVLILGLAGFAAAQDPAKVYVIHGIPGTDLGLDPALPVDVEIEEPREFTLGSLDALGEREDDLDIEEID